LLTLSNNIYCTGLTMRFLAVAQTQGRFQVQKCGVNTHGERGARAYNGSLEKAPSRVRGRAAGQGVTCAKPPEAENLSAFGCQTEAANLPHFRILEPH